MALMELRAKFSSINREINYIGVEKTGMNNKNARGFEIKYNF